VTMDIQTEELKEEKNAVRKDQLLQKYGIIPPKLIWLETECIRLEALGYEARIVRAMHILEGAE
jgi:hypothetical protein